MGEGQIDFHAPADGKKRKARRVCDITGMVEPWLREAFDTSQTGHIIERNGKPVRDIHTEFKAMCRSLHLVDFRFHDLDQRGRQAHYGRRSYGTDPRCAGSFDGQDY